MKKVFLLATAALFITGATYAEGGKGKNKKACAKGKACCHKGCCDKNKSKTANM